jgi:hypothetical protein
LGRADASHDGDSLYYEVPIDPRQMGDKTNFKTGAIDNAGIGLFGVANLPGLVDVLPG